MAKEKVASWVWVAVIGVGLLIAYKLLAPKPQTTSAGASIFDVTKLFGDVASTVGNFFKPAPAPTFIPNPGGGNTLPGSPIFGPTLENGNLFT